MLRRRVYAVRRSRFARGDASLPQTLEDLDIFDLVPFSSDIDLEHTGSGKQTYEILLKIQEQVPFASWFRWSLIDHARAQKAAEQRAISTAVPLRQLRFSTARDADIPDQALRDLEQHRVTFERNPAFHGHRRGVHRRDVEIYGLMMALNVVAELHDIAGGEPAFDKSAIIRWLRGTGHRDLRTAAVDARLAARFWHMLAVQLARLGRDAEMTAELLNLASNTDVLRHFDIDLKALGATGQAFSVSKFTADDNFRIPELTPVIRDGDDGYRALQTVIQDLRIRAGFSPVEIVQDVATLIDPAFELIAVIPELTIKPYAAAASQEDDETDVYYSGMEQEFVEIAWQEANRLPGHPRGLTAQVVPWGDLAQTVATSALPAVGGIFGTDRPWVRARLDDLVERNPGRGDGKASLVILQAKNA